MNVYIVKEQSTHDLQVEVNRRIAKIQFYGTNEVVDIKYSSNETSYSAMIIYKEKEQ